jgi:hypothetical protein
MGNNQVRASFASARKALQSARIWKEKADLVEHLAESFTELRGVSTGMREAQMMYVDIAMACRKAAKNANV